MSNFEKKNIYLVKKEKWKSSNKEKSKEDFFDFLEFKKFEAINNEGDYNFNEVERTIQDEVFINKWIEEINKENKTLGVNEEFKIDYLNQIHFCDPKDSYNFGNNSAGFFVNDTKNLYINVNAKPQNKYKTLLHEMIHMSAISKIAIEDKNFSERTGYALNGTNEMKFYLFNEAVTEKITLDLFSKNSDFIKNELDVGEDSFENLKEKSYYNFEIEIFDIILREVSRNLEVEVEELWEKIKKGYFDGGMMHLRIFEKVYGKNFLKIIALSENIFRDSNCKKEDVKIFFSEIDNKKRDEIAKKILPKKNYQIYLDIKKT